MTNNIGYGTVHRSHDRARAYLFLKERVDGLFQFRGARHGDDVVRSLLLASFNNGYVEGSAGLLDACGQTVRNHLRYQDPLRLLAANDRAIGEMRSLGALSKHLILAIDWHEAEGRLPPCLQVRHGECADERGARPRSGS